MIESLPLPSTVDSKAGELRIRRAAIKDLDAVLAFLYDDPISQARGDVADSADGSIYERALREIVEDARNELVVAVEPTGTIVGTLQLTSIPGLARRGATRLLVEAVRVAPALRSSGIGSAMMRWVTEVAAPAIGARMVQLTSDASRTEAGRFYRRLGFTDSHLGFTYMVAP
jgi:GNAT superfamily N-acetyltransferase